MLQQTSKKLSHENYKAIRVVYLKNGIALYNVAIEGFLEGWAKSLVAPGMRNLEVGQGASAGAPDSQTMTSPHRQTRAVSPALSRHKRVISYIIIIDSGETVTNPRVAAAAARARRIYSMMRDHNPSIQSSAANSQLI